MKKLEQQAAQDLAKLYKQNTLLTDDQLDQAKLDNQSIIDLIDAKNDDGITLLHLAITFSKTIKLNEFFLTTDRIHIENLIVIIKYLLNKKIDLNATVAGLSALMFIVSNKALEILGDAERDQKIIKILLAHKADTSIIDPDGNTLLHYASLRPPLIFNQIVEVCPDKINAKNKEGQTPLFLAAKRYFAYSESLNVVEKLIQSGADVNVIDHSGQSILSYYLKNTDYASQNLSTVRNLFNILLDAGINFNHSNPDGSTIADLAAEAHIPMSVFEKHLMRDTKLPEDASLLHYAAATNATSFIKYLVTQTDINTKLSDGRTPLQIAIDSAGIDSDLVRTLIIHGAEIHETLREEDKARLRALDIKVLDVKKQEEFEKLREKYTYYSQNKSIDNPEQLRLKEYNLSDLIEAEDDEGNTLLHLSMSSYRYGQSPLLFQYLLSKGADPTQKNKKGITPLDMLTDLFSKKKFKIEKDFLDLLLKNIDAKILKSLPQNLKNILFVRAVQLEYPQSVLENLLSAGAEINSLYKGQTALHYASANNNLEQVNWLLTNRANPDIADSDGNPLLHSVMISYGQRNHKRITPGPEQSKKQRELLSALVTNPHINKNSTNSRGLTPLFLVDDCKIFEELVNNGADPHAKDKEGNTVLQREAKEGNLELCTYIADKYPEMLTVVNNMERSALFEATNHEIILLFAKHHPELIKQKDKEGYTPLQALMFHHSFYHDLSENQNNSIKALIDHGADSSFMYNNAAFVFYLARNANQGVIESLLKKGIDPTLTTNYGFSFASIALSNSKISPEAFSTYIKGDAKLPNTATLLHYAVHNNMLDLIWPLTQVQHFDINENIEREGGKATPLLIAIERHGAKSPMVKQLIKLGAKIPDSLSPQETLEFAILNFKKLFKYKKNNDQYNWNHFIDKPGDKDTSPMTLFFDFISSGKNEFIEILSHATDLGEQSKFATGLADRLCNDTVWPAYQKAKFTTSDLANISKLGLNTDGLKPSLKDQPDLQNALFALIAYAGKLVSENKQDDHTQMKISAITTLVNNIIATNDPDVVNDLLDKALKNDDLTQNRTTGFYRLYSIFKSEHKWNKPAKHVVRSTTEELLINLKQVFNAKNTKIAEPEDDDISSDQDDSSTKSSSN